MGPAGPDDVPEVRLAAIGEVLRDAVETGLTANQACRPAEQLRAQPEPPVPEPVPTFAGANTLSAEPDLAQRVEEILRTQPPGTACVIPSTPAVTTNARRIGSLASPARGLRTIPVQDLFELGRGWPRASQIAARVRGRRRRELRLSCGSLPSGG